MEWALELIEITRIDGAIKVDTFSLMVSSLSFVGNRNIFVLLKSQIKWKYFAHQWGHKTKHVWLQLSPTLP